MREEDWKEGSSHGTGSYTCNSRAARRNGKTIEEKTLPVLRENIVEIKAQPLSFNASAYLGFLFNIKSYVHSKPVQHIR